MIKKNCFRNISQKEGEWCYELVNEITSTDIKNNINSDIVKNQRVLTIEHFNQSLMIRLKEWKSLDQRAF